MSADRLWARLMRNIAEPENEQACWNWARRKDDWGYGLINIHTPGLGRNATLKVHVVLWALLKAPEACATANDLYLACKELTTSGLQLDHICANAACINPDHLQLIGAAYNQQLRGSRLRAKTQSRIHLYG